MSATRCHWPAVIHHQPHTVAGQSVSIQLHSHWLVKPVGGIKRKRHNQSGLGNGEYISFEYPRVDWQHPTIHWKIHTLFLPAHKPMHLLRGFEETVCELSVCVYESEWYWWLSRSLAWTNYYVSVPQSRTLTWPEPSTYITTFFNHLWETSRWNTTARSKNPHATLTFFCVAFCFICGCPPISFQNRFTICFACAIFSLGSRVLSFSSQPFHFFSNAQPVLSENGWWFVTSAKCILVSGSLQKCLRECGV